jgi:hypothetical protein
LTALTRVQIPSATPNKSLRATAPGFPPSIANPIEPDLISRAKKAFRWHRFQLGLAQARHHNTRAKNEHRSYWAIMITAPSN